VSEVEDTFDLVILGSGSTAFAAALRAAELGKTAAMTEERMLGGTCVNRGCLPSKDLIEAAHVFWDAAHPRFPGLGARQLGLDFAALVAGKDQLIEEYRAERYEAVVEDSDRISILDGHAEFADPHTIRLDGREIRGDQILVATGSRPADPRVPGLDGVPYLTSDLLGSGEPSELTEQPRSVAIVGGGYIALELGQLFSRLGTAVTILERSERILPRHEPEASTALHEALTDEGVELRTGVRIRGVRREPGGVAVVLDDVEVRAERLLVASGRVPNTDRIGANAAGIALDDRGFVTVDERLRTNVPHIWAAGDVIGTHAESQQATPVGAHDGNIAAGNALGGEVRIADHAVIPRTIFTDPQVAVVGLTDAEAIGRGRRCVCNTIPMHLVPRAGVARDERGIIKMVREQGSDRVLGVTMVGRNAGEVIHEAAMAMRFGATVHDFIDMVHVYPTMAEALKIVALSFFKDVSKMSCCAE